MKPFANRKAAKNEGTAPKTSLEKMAVRFLKRAHGLQGRSVLIEAVFMEDAVYFCGVDW